jgi:hypothetical protein
MTHIHANEIPFSGPHYIVRLDGVILEEVVEAAEGPQGFAFIDPTYYAPPGQSLYDDAGWEKDESDPGPAWVLFGNVTLEPIPSTLTICAKEEAAEIFASYRKATKQLDEISAVIRRLNGGGQL